MNLCIVSFQAVLLAILVQYHFINEVSVRLYLDQNMIRDNNRYNLTLTCKLQKTYENLNFPVYHYPFTLSLNYLSTSCDSIAGGIRYVEAAIELHRLNSVQTMQFVEAEKKSYVSIGNWFSGLEKKVDDVPHRIRMNKVFQQIKKTTENILAYPSYFFHEAFGTGTDHKETSNKDTDNRHTVNKDHNEGVKISDLLNSQELRDLVAVNDISDMTSEVKYEAEPEALRQVVLEKQEAPKRKRRIKKHKKRNKGKHDQREHIPHEQRLDASVEQDKEQFGKRDMRKNQKKREKEINNQRKFVKTLPKESNSSESEEVVRRKPVDIIVHIKMND